MDPERLAVPDNVQALLTARIDRLEEDAGNSHTAGRPGHGTGRDPGSGPGLHVPSLAQITAAATDLLEQTIALARTLGDEATEARALWNAMILDLYSGKAQQGIEAGKQSVAP